MPEIYKYCMASDRPMWPPGAEIQAQAYDAFEEWRQQNDPDGDWDILDAINKYAEHTN